MLGVISDDDVALGGRLAETRERAGFSQDEVATLVDQPRPIVSFWESGKRRPNAHQLWKLAAIYRVPIDELLGTAAPRPRVDFERLLYRDAGKLIDFPSGRYEIQRFLAFLDGYGEMLEALGEPPGMIKSPLSVRDGLLSKEDIRRKAEDARNLFRLGTGPVGDLSALADLFGITVYLAPLGKDLKTTVSGAFLPHHRAGFSILVNAETTPGRRQFTLAHEIAHALFHGDRIYVGYFGRKEATERFANAFAAEFLVPIQSLRSAAESLGLTRVRDAEVIIHLQRLFKVSYAMMLVRLGVANLVSKADQQSLRRIRPVHLAEELGYPTATDEWFQDPDRWGLARFPRRFLRLLRRSLDEGRITLSGAAEMTGLAQEDIESFLDQEPPPEIEDEEFDYLSESA